MSLVESLLQQTANGIVVGMVYALVSLGLTLVMGVLGVLNFAHGEFYVLGGYTLMTIGQRLGIGYVAAGAVAIAVTALAGSLAERLVVRPVVSREPLNAMLVTFGVSLLMLNLMQTIYSPTPYSVASPFGKVIALGPVLLPMQKLLVVGVGGASIVAVHLMLMRTTLGRMIRATAQQPVAASLVGIRVGAIHNFTFAIGTGFAALAGVLLMPITGIYPTAGQGVIIKGFVVVILGGMGNIYGAAVGGLFLGMVESIAVMVMPGEWTSLIGFALLILVLLFRPEGLLSVRGGTRV